MIRIFTVLLAMLIGSSAIYAAPGDTTHVQAQDDVWLKYNGNYDTTVGFPDGSTSYRKIRMTFTLGKYQCPADSSKTPPKPPQYCGDWDYTVQLFIMTKAGDTMEIGRMITPYANATYPRTPWNWKERYEYDVTDFYNQLKDTPTIRIHYSGYSGGFTGNIKFDMIEGTPPRNVLKVDKAWGTSSRFGDTAANTSHIEDRVDTVNLSVPGGTKFSELKFTVTGHGNDDYNCCEFSNKYYEVVLNGNKFDKTQIWRDNCGSNHLYPQSGTWLLQRANWCPGDIVFPNRHKLAGLTAGNSYDLDVDFEKYIGKVTINGRSWGSYIVQGNVFYYGDFNKNLDASLEGVVAPNDHEMYFRYNPVSGHPIIIVKNTGSTTITALKLKYEIQGGSGANNYSWTGSIAPLDTAWIECPFFFGLANASGAGNVFNAEIVSVNNASDDDATNNKVSTTFTAARKIPLKIIIHLKTNKATTLKGVSETSWKLIDVITGRLVAEKNDAPPNTNVKDTLTLLKGTYKLVVEDASCDGLNWWANSGTVGKGFIAVYDAFNNSPITLDGQFGGDFGCGFTEYWNATWPTSVKEITYGNQGISVYPNPANSNINVSLEGMEKVNGTIQLVDMTGRVVLSEPCTSNIHTINVSAFVNGVYTVMFKGADNTRLVSRVVIAK